MLKGYCILILFSLAVMAKEEIKQQNSNKFIPTNEWQTIPEGQGIPPGLHVRIDMQTGKKEAKLLNDEPAQPASPSSSALINTETKDEEPNKWDASEIKEALKKIKNDANKIEGDEPSNTFRSYDEIKEEMKKLEQSIKTEYEIVKDLVVRYSGLQEDSARMATLEDLEYYVHQYDNALDFVNMGGFKSIILPALNNTNSQLRSAAAFLLGSACQSNPKAQIEALEVGSLPLLIRLVSFDTNSEVRNRALYAISGVVRNFPLAQKALVENGGLSSFHKVLESSTQVAKLQLRIVTLLSDLMTERSAVIDQMQEMDGNRSSESYKFLAEKKKQHDAAGVAEKVVEQGFCQLLPRLLTDDEHDIVEKVVQAMLSLSTHCSSQFHPVRNLIHSLGDRYHKLSSEEETEGDAVEEPYYTKMYNLCSQLYTQLQSRDEL